MNWFQNTFAAVIGVITGAVASMQMQAQKWEDKWEAKRTATFASFNETCPYMKGSLVDYKRAWDRQYPYDAVVVMFAKNQKQYFPDLDEEKAKACFNPPVPK